MDEFFSSPSGKALHATLCLYLSSVYWTKYGRMRVLTKPYAHSELLALKIYVSENPLFQIQDRCMSPQRYYWQDCIAFVPYKTSVGYLFEIYLLYSLIILAFRTNEFGSFLSLFHTGHRVDNKLKCQNGYFDPWWMIQTVYICWQCHKLIVPFAEFRTSHQLATWNESHWDAICTPVTFNFVLTVNYPSTGSFNLFSYFVKFIYQLQINCESW